MTIGNGEPVDAALGWKPALYYREEQYGTPGGFEAGYMEISEAAKLVSVCLSEFLGTDVTWHVPEDFL